MKLSFESNLDYQLAAVKSAVDLFEGQPTADSVDEIPLAEPEELSLACVTRNRLALSDEQLLTNLRTVQARNDIAQSEKLEGRHFSIEMETGTGKTYVYLRTIYELSKKYGFKKFVIVVPSIAIREGVLKNLQITHGHFQNLYDNVPFHFQVYDSGRVSSLRGFATSNAIEVLVINIDSFAKDENIINKPNDKLSGRKPVQFIQAVSPIVIVDEPQNMETDKRSAAIGRLNPLCTLRYSATHRNVYNLIYSLNPVKAYDLGLVKQIEVDSVLEESPFNGAYVVLESIKSAKTKVTAKVRIHCSTKDGVAEKEFTVRVGDDLYRLSNEREVYSDGYIVEEIDAGNECIAFANGNILFIGQHLGGMADEVMRFQIRRTVEEHLRKELKYRRLGIKVLSLFFIDRVANYRAYDEQGRPVAGKFARWFEEAYSELIQKSTYRTLDTVSVDKVHNGYFSQDKKGRLKDTNGETQADDDTYSLIMKDKETLLDISNPLRFIFSHSALREGWDNPNVFQICTLNETKSDIKKRQEIGRGLRLPVNQEGVRIYDSGINRLTVIANESYEDFAKALQSEFEEDCGMEFRKRVKNAHKRKAVKYRKGFEVDPRFLEIWERIKYRTTYRVNYKTDELIDMAAKHVATLPPISAPLIRSTKVKVTMSGDQGVGTQFLSENPVKMDSQPLAIPDVLGYIQNKTELTRATIMSILEKSGKMAELARNPQLFMDCAVEIIRKELYSLMISGIKYERIGNREYEMTLFEDRDLEIYLNSFTFKVGSVDSSKADKTIYANYIPLDSDTETQFAKDCEASEQVEFYFKLPNWFRIPTPIGAYNPDWAVVFKDERKIYFVAETKNTGEGKVDLEKLSGPERLKIKCGKAHYALFTDVEYRVVKTVGDLNDGN